MKIREITKNDRGQIHRLALEEHRILNQLIFFPIYKVKFNKKLFNKLFAFHFKKSHVFYGIEVDGKIVAIISGYIQKAPQGKVGYIDNMMVSKKYRGKGYAKILRDKFFQWLKQKKINYCKLEVLAKNASAIKIYKKWGFKEDGLQMTKKFD